MRITAFTSIVLLLACAGSSPPPAQYLLRAHPAESAGRVEATVRVALGRIAVAPYLDQSGIVVQTEAGQVRVAHQHEWAEPLDAGLRSYLRAEMSEALGYDVSARAANRVQWDYTVDVYVDQLHGTMAGTAVIDAGYRITPRAGAGEVVEYRVSRSASLPREGYPGLVDAEAELARELARAIAASLREIGEEQPPTHGGDGR
jgi:uncharacterized lipoprotein YmbA